MIVAIHQPHYLPWLGYLDRMRQADLFIVLDHVQFERRNYQNRARIVVDGAPQWLTVPVEQHSQKERIDHKRIAHGETDSPRYWGTRHYQTLAHAYRKAPYFENYAEPLADILYSRPTRLVDLTARTLGFLREAFGITTPVLYSSTLKVQGQRSEMILSLCRAVGAETYLAGLGGSRVYLDQPAFARAGVHIEWQQFRHPIYAQCGGGEFLPGLAAVDLLFNHGPNSLDILAGAAREEDQAAFA